MPRGSVWQARGRLLLVNDSRDHPCRAIAGPFTLWNTQSGGERPSALKSAARQLVIYASLLVVVPVSAETWGLEMCRPRQPNTSDKTCIVDGDTLWLNGMNLRLRNFDTPEPSTAICGGASEVELAHQASARLRELLNVNSWTLETFGADRHGRTLATIRIGGVDVGDILISERLARRWPDGHEWWCQ